jgi:hypothetical protein
MGWSEKIDRGANGEAIFYWIIPLYLKPSKNVLTERKKQM